MKKTIGILAIALLIGMALPALAAVPPEGTGVAEANGAATNNGFLQTANSAAAGEGHNTLAQTGSVGEAILGSTNSFSVANSNPNANGPGKENVTANTDASASGQAALTDANGIAINDNTGTANAGPGNTHASGTSATAVSSSFAGTFGVTDISGNSYFGNGSAQLVESIGFNPGSSTSSNQATANETS